MEPTVIVRTKMSVWIIVSLTLVAVGVSVPLILTAIRYPELRFVMSMITASVYLLVLGNIIQMYSLHLMRDVNRALIHYISVMNHYQRKSSNND
jgi:hypothetical protein